MSLKMVGLSPTFKAINIHGTPQINLTGEDLRKVRATILVAEEVGTELARGQILQRRLPTIEGPSSDRSQAKIEVSVSP